MKRLRVMMMLSCCAFGISMGMDQDKGWSKKIDEESNLRDLISKKNHWSVKNNPESRDTVRENDTPNSYVEAYRAATQNVKK